ncbi:uncharacterized protein LOC123012113 [Tribolium madens]|uniref:uncharacterized protein LOC123012113 n=1 Tax=Tribolium madens TaxID=41895 RepID=UPI001CF7344F|nr:uncharacterized protein LOC123012113 [Tribolium madens]
MEKTDNLEEVEARKRRSSILKARKSRNPLEEIDANETSPNMTPTKPVRRVSFASSNFIKPFVADPDQNTIWDNTIEEDVNHTNSTQSSGCNSGMELTRNDKGAHTVPSLLNTTMLDESMMEMTCHSVAKKFENPLISNCDDVFVQEDEMDLTGVSDCDEKNDNQEINTNGGDMEFTCQIPELSKTVKDKNQTLREAVDMEFTSQIPNISGVTKESTCQVPKLSNSVNVSKNDETMEFTCQVPTNFKCQIPGTEKPQVFDKENVIMSHSQISIINCGMSEQSKKLSSSDTETMEFTCQIPKSSKVTSLYVNVSKIGNDDETTEFICQIPTTTIKTPNVKCQIPSYEKSEFVDKEYINITRHNEMPELSKIDTETMGYSCQIPITTDTKDVKTVNFKCQIISTENPKIIDKENINIRHNEMPEVSKYDNKIRTPPVTEKLVKMRHSQIPIVNCKMPQLSNTVTETMEFTCQIPQHLSIDTEAMEISVKNDVERHNEMPELSKIDNKISTPLKMNFTCLNPVTEKLVKENTAKLRHSQIPIVNCEMPQLSNTVTETMEFTCQMPKHLSIDTEAMETSVKNDNEMPELSKIDNKATEILCQISPPPEMNSTCQIPEKLVKENAVNQIPIVNCKMPQLSNSLTETMEFTCQMPKLPSFDIEAMETSEKTVNVNEIIDKENSVRHSQIPIVNCKMPQLSKIDKLSTMKYTCQMSKLPNTDTEVVKTSEKNDVKTVKCQTPRTPNFGKFEMPDKENIVTMRHSQIPLVNCEIPQPINNLSHVEAVNFKCQTPKTPKFGKYEIIDKENTINIRNTEASIVNCEMPELSNNDTATVEFTCQLSKLSIPEMNSMCQIPNVSCKMPQLPTNDTQTMEFTCQIPKLSMIDECRSPTIVKTTELSKINKNEDWKNVSKVVPETPQNTTCQNLKQKNQTPKHESSYCEAPEPSFHINLTNISSEVDNTQHLLDYKISHMENSMVLDDVSLLDVHKSRLMNINDTYVLKNKMATKFDSEDDSLGVLPDECFTEFEDNHEAKQYDFDIFRHPKSKKSKLEIKTYPNLEELIDIARKQREFIKDYLENFKFRKIKVVDLSKKPTPVAVETPEEKEEEEIKKHIPTIKETVTKYEESAQKCWKLESIKDDIYHISTLFASLVLNVQLDVGSGVVLNIEISTRLQNDSKPIDHFIVNYFIEKLKDNHLVSALGRNYDILSLLDYVKMTVLKIRSFLDEFQSIEWMIFNRDFVATYKIMEVDLELMADVMVDMSDVDNIDFDKNVTIVEKIGSVNRQELLDFAKTCPKGLAFFKGFSECIEKYVKVKEKRKCFTKRYQ